MKPGLWILLFSTILLSACATRPTAPAEELGAASSAIASAEEAGAREHAPAELRQAREKLERAQVARNRGDRGDYDLARRLATEAEVDARLAAFKSRAAQTDAVISELEQSNADLRAEIQAASATRSTGGNR